VRVKYDQRSSKEAFDIQMRFLDVIKPAVLRLREKALRVSVNVKLDGEDEDDRLWEYSRVNAVQIDLGGDKSDMASG
jgi:hypothetical protein